MKPSSKYKRKRSEIEEVKSEEQLLNIKKFAFLKNVKKLKTEKDQISKEIISLKAVKDKME